MSRLTCRDTDDAAYWRARLEEVDQPQVEALLDEMLELVKAMRRKGITPRAPKARFHEGGDLYRDRFGTPWVPF